MRRDNNHQQPSSAPAAVVYNVNQDLVSHMESLDGGFFEVRSRSGDPTTEDLHARTAQPKVCEGLACQCQREGEQRCCTCTEKQGVARTPLGPEVARMPLVRKELGTLACRSTINVSILSPRNRNPCARPFVWEIQTVSLLYDYYSRN